MAQMQLFKASFADLRESHSRSIKWGTAQATVKQFVESDFDIAEVKGEWKEPRFGVNTLRAAIYRLKIAGIKPIMDSGKVYLVKIDKIPEVGTKSTTNNT